MTITKKEIYQFNMILAKANDKELRELLKELEKEIRLSNTAIREGFEKSHISRKKHYA